MSTYIFIDGAYLRAQHSLFSQKWFGFDAGMVYEQFMATLHSMTGPESTPWYVPVENRFYTQSAEKIVTKSFYYDCLDEERRPDESKEAFSDRIEKQNALLEGIRSVEGCHIRHCGS